LGIDHWLHLHLAAGVVEEASHLAEGDRSYSFEPANAAAQCFRTSGRSEQRLIAEMDVQHHLGPQLAVIDSGRPNDQPRTGRLVRRLGL
jgi:hypothetical protein